jgi:hypothetical protein
LIFRATSAPIRSRSAGAIPAASPWAKVVRLSFVYRASVSGAGAAIRDFAEPAELAQPEATSAASARMAIAATARFDRIGFSFS